MSDFFPGIAWLIPFFPLLGAVRGRSGAPARCGADAHIPVVAGIALAFLVSLGLLFSADARQDDLRDELADDQRLRGPDRVSHRRPDHDDAVDGDVRLVAGGRLRGRLHGRRPGLSAGSSP